LQFFLKGEGNGSHDGSATIELWEHIILWSSQKLVGVENVLAVERQFQPFVVGIVDAGNYYNKV
jgi:hypothetical protein